MKEIESLLAGADREGRSSLSEVEVYGVLDLLGLATPKRLLLAGGVPIREKELKARLADFPGQKVVLKVSSAQTLHKTEAGAVKVCSKSEAPEQLASMRARFPA